LGASPGSQSSPASYVSSTCATRARLRVTVGIIVIITASTERRYGQEKREGKREGTIADGAL
jgi:hypothetical protein